MTFIPPPDSPNDPSGVPSAEIVIGEELVRHLLRTERPEFASLPIYFFSSGWDNVMIRLGDKMMIRIPRRSVGGFLIKQEQRWLPTLAPRLPIKVPVPIHIGKPTDRFPWHWSILPWFEGGPASKNRISKSEVTVLVQFLKALHQPTPKGAPINPYRGIPLQDCAEKMSSRIAQSRISSKISAEIRQIWQDGLLAKAPTNSVWIHGDLHPMNILLVEGKIEAIIDWGDVTAGDSATDLASIWMLFYDQETRQQALTEYGVAGNHDTIARARAWAALFGVMMLDAGSVNDQNLANLGSQILANLEV